MSDRVPFVTVLIPARDEAADIERCLLAVLAQTHPHDRMEVVLVDGGSTDTTRLVAQRVLSRGDIFWKVIGNPVGTTPSNLNAGLSAASGEIICRVDARSLIPPHYVSVSVHLLQTRSDVAVTGGAQVATPRPEDTLVARGIARGLNNRWAMGGSRYRRHGRSGPSDTVYLGAFRTVDLLAIGGWDERMATNQDFDLNRRMSENGLIWFCAEIPVQYLPRRSLAAIWRQYVRFGRAKVQYWELTATRPSVRQLVLLALPPTALIAGLAIGHRRPAVAASGGLALVLLDVTGVRQPAPIAERVVGLVTSALAGAGWWVGVMGQLCSTPRVERTPAGGTA